MLSLIENLLSSHIVVNQLIPNLIFVVLILFLTTSLIDLFHV